MATIKHGSGQWRQNKELWVDLAHTLPQYKTIAQVGDRVEMGDINLAFSVAAVRQNGTRVYYTPVDGSVEAIGPDAAAEEERLGGSIPRLAGDRFE